MGVGVNVGKGVGVTAAFTATVPNTMPCVKASALKVVISTVWPVSRLWVDVNDIPGKTKVGIPAIVTVNSDKLLFTISTKTSCAIAEVCVKIALIVPKATGVFVKPKP